MLFPLIINIKLIWQRKRESGDQIGSTSASNRHARSNCRVDIVDDMSLLAMPQHPGRLHAQRQQDAALE